MRKIFLLLIAIALVSNVSAQPLTLQQPDNVLEENTLEVGLADITYQNDLTEITNTAGNLTVAKVTNTGTNIPVSFRYALNPKIELLLSLPYLTLTQKSEIGAFSDTTDDAKLSDAVIGAKYNIKDDEIKVGGGLNIAVPTGSESTKFSNFRNGINVNPVIAASKKISKINVTGNLSYNLTGEFENASKIKEDPADVLAVGVGAEYPLESINLIGEFNYRNLSESKYNEVAQAGTAGSQMDLVVGMRFNPGKIKTKLGVALALGEEKYRTYDYKVLLGLTYLVQL